MNLSLPRCSCVTVVAALCLSPAGNCSPGNYIETVAHYTVSSRGFAIGDVTTSQRMTAGAGAASVTFETKTAVKASFLWMKYHQSTIERGTVLKGDLVSYARKGQENGTMIDIEGRLENSVFRFDVREQGTTRSIVLSRNSYDYTTMECPEARLEFPDSTPVTLRVLDVEKMAVVKREYRLIRSAHYSIDGNQYPCRIVDFSDQNKKARRWITWDGLTAVLYRQDGQGERNSYSLQTASISRKM